MLVNQSSQVKVCVIDTIESPPHSEAILQRSVSGLTGEVLIESKHDISCSNSLLYPARSIACISNGMVLVNIVNTKCCPVKIVAGTWVGTAEVLKGQEVKQTIEGNSKSLARLDEIDLMSSVVSEDEKRTLVKLLVEYSDVFVPSDIDLSKAHQFSHKIDTGENDPLFQRPYRSPQSQLAIIYKRN